MGAELSSIESVSVINVLNMRTELIITARKVFHYSHNIWSQLEYNKVFFKYVLNVRVTARAA